MSELTQTAYSVYLFVLGLRISALNSMLCFFLGKKGLLPIAFRMSRSLLKSRYSFVFAEERCKALYYQRGEG